jgi:hypothetical protein
MEHYSRVYTVYKDRTRIERIKEEDGSITEIVERD